MNLNFEITLTIIRSFIVICMMMVILIGGGIVFGLLVPVGYTAIVIGSIYKNNKFITYGEVSTKDQDRDFAALHNLSLLSKIISVINTVMFTIIFSVYISVDGVVNHDTVTVILIPWICSLLLVIHSHSKLSYYKGYALGEYWGEE